MCGGETVPCVPLYEAVDAHYRPYALSAIFHPLFLANFDYKIVYKSATEHCNADGLSRLPLQQKELKETEVDSSEVFHATQFVPLPVTSKAVARETRRDSVLARGYELIVKGWSARLDGDKSCYKRRNELTVHHSMGNKRGNP